MNRRIAEFVRSQTVVAGTQLVPEVRLHLAAQPFEIFQAAEDVGLDRPFWAFAWPGGQAIARWLLDHPEEVAGTRVLDIGAGSAITAIAARLAGAAHVTANDTDPTAGVAAGLNAALNGVTVAVETEDALARPIACDVIVLGEVFYEPEMAVRITSFLEGAARRGVKLLFADRPGVRRPPVPMQLLATMPAQLTPGLDLVGMSGARVWRLQATTRIRARSMKPEAMA
ncbi:MAG: class I SAM-dependent methyltransferase [Hyphomicrobiaceae bacterium]